MAKKIFRVAMLIAPANFRDEEYFQPKVMLDAVGISISTVAKGDPEEVTGTKGGKAHIDAKLEDITPQAYDGLVLVGGQGATTYFEDKDIHLIINSFTQAGKIIAAICIAPVILAKSGVLSGKNATVFDEGINELLSNGVNYIKKPMVIDGNFITASDYSVAMKFGEKIAERVKSQL